MPADPLQQLSERTFERTAQHPPPTEWAENPAKPKQIASRTLQPANWGSIGEIVLPDFAERGTG